jgi:hypothetical protein
MAALDLVQIQQKFLENISSNLLNLLIYSAAMVVYAIILWKFYQNLAKKNLFGGELKDIKHKHILLNKLWQFIRFLFRYSIMFPLISFIWFLILSAFLLFLSKSQDVGQILLMSMTIIAASRITAYYNEDLSRDVAKLIPLSLMGVFIVDPSYFSIEATIQKFLSVPSFLGAILQYWVFIVALELMMHLFVRARTAITAQGQADKKSDLAED